MSQDTGDYLVFPVSRFQTNREYQTRDGRRARFLAATTEYASFEIQLSGMPNNNRGWYRALRNADGTYYDTHKPDDRDIIEITATPDEINIMNRMANADPREFILILRELRL